MRRRKRLPAAVDSTNCKVPEWASAIQRAIGKPSPVPPETAGSRERDRSMRKKTFEDLLMRLGRNSSASVNDIDEVAVAFRLE